MKTIRISDTTYKRLQNYGTDTETTLIVFMDCHDFMKVALPKMDAFLINVQKFLNKF